MALPHPAQLGTIDPFSYTRRGWGRDLREAVAVRVLFTCLPFLGHFHPLVPLTR